MSRPAFRILFALLVLFAVFAAPPPRCAFALIIVGKGSKPLNDPGWPVGAAVIFNHEGRVAWWEGPPYGGGQWHAECRGDAKALSAVLADFAKVDVQVKRVVIHNRAGHSFVLGTHQEQKEREASRIDWVFMVWQPAAWKRLHERPIDVQPADADHADPPCQIDVFTPNIRWNDVTVPAGIEVVDERLEAHGFTPADGIVLEGQVVDLSTGRPLVAAVKLQRVDPRSKGRLFPVIAETKSEANGKWVLKNVPGGNVRLLVEAEGYAPRIITQTRLEDQPQWKYCATELVQPAEVAGRITDPSGNPLADVEVRFDTPRTPHGRYRLPTEVTIKTDAEGRFRADLPAGNVTIRVHKNGYCRPGLGLPVAIPADDVELTMIRSGRIRVTVDFGGKQRPESYIVQIEPEGGSEVRSYGGSGNIDEMNQITFANVPPARYVLVGHPNPYSGNQVTEPIPIDLKGGDSAEIMLKAR